MQAEISADVMQMLNKVFAAFDGEMDEKLKCLYEDLKKKSNLEAKIKLGMPFISYLGGEISLEMQTDINVWLEKLRKKYKMEVLESMKYVF
jgi:hypothetical protein